MSHGKLEREKSPLALATFNPDCSLMPFKDAIDRGKAEAHAVAFLFRGEKGFKDIGKVFFRDAAPRVPHEDFDYLFSGIIMY